MLDLPTNTCTCCEREVDEQLVTAPRRDGSLQHVCRACRKVILGVAQWDGILASTGCVPDLPPMPDTGRCTCGALVYYVRAERVGERGYFECGAPQCGRRYRFVEEGWTPGATRVP